MRRNGGDGAGCRRFAAQGVYEALASEKAEGSVLSRKDRSEREGKEADVPLNLHPHIIRENN